MAQASTIKVGDLMDLEHDPAAQALMTDVDKQAAEFDYFRVYEVHRRGGQVLIGWEGIGGLAEYPADAELDTAALELHVFNPDHNLVCEDCGEGELAGRHGITGICDGHNHYESAEAAAMYGEDGHEAWITTHNEFYAPNRERGQLKVVEVAADLFMALQREARRATTMQAAIIEELRLRAWQERAASTIGRTTKQSRDAAEHAAKRLEWLAADIERGALPKLTAAAGETAAAAVEATKPSEPSKPTSGLLPDVVSYLKMVQQDNSVPSWLTFGAGELLARIEAVK